MQCKLSRIGKASDGPLQWGFCVGSHQAVDLTRRSGDKMSGRC